MLSALFLQLHTATYEWGKECPPDAKNALTSFFLSTEFLDRTEVFYYGKKKRMAIYHHVKEGASNINFLM